MVYFNKGGACMIPNPILIAMLKQLYQHDQAHSSESSDAMF